MKHLIITTSLIFLNLIVYGNRAEGPLIKSPLKMGSQEKLEVYFLSGLGADERAFAKLQLDKTRFNINYIDWIDPIKNESIQSYAKRLSAQIDPTRAFSLVGLSFGGIIASEMTAFVRPQKVVIISSHSTGIPVSRFYQGLLKFLVLSPLSGPILKSPNAIVYRYFGADTPELKGILKQILKDTDTRFLKWAMIRLSSWKRPERVENLYHIHGTADKLIPISMARPDYKVSNGGHLMVLAQHEIISRLLNEQLSN